MGGVGGVNPSTGLFGLDANELSIFNALTGHYLSDVTKVTIEDDTALSMQEYNSLLGSAQVNTLHANEKILALGPNVAAAFFRYIATTATDLLSLYYTNEATFLTETTDAAGRKPFVEAINNDIDTLQMAINNQTDSYNSLGIKLNAYNVASSNLGTPPTQAQLDSYNLARAQYYDAVNTYNGYVGDVNTALSDYQTDVAAYQGYLDTTVNPDIDQLNLERERAGITPPVAYATIPPGVKNFTFLPNSPATNLSSPGPISLDSHGNLPAGEPEVAAALPPINLPSQLPQPLVDPTTIKFQDAQESFLVSAQPLFDQWINQQIANRNSVGQNLVGDDYRQAVGTLPISYFNSHLGAAVQSAGAQNMTTFITGLDLVSVNAIVPHSVYNNFFAGTTAIPSPKLYSEVVLTTVTSGQQVAQISSPTGAIYLGEVPKNTSLSDVAINTAVATGNLNTAIGLLNGGGFVTALSALTDSNSALRALTPTQKASLEESIGALSSNGLLQLNVGSLSQQLSLPETNHVFGVALLAANPTALENQKIFEQQAHQFETLGTQYGSQGVLSPLTTYLESQIAKKGVPQELADQAADQIAKDLGRNGFGRSAEELQGRITGILQASVGEEAAQSIGSSVLQNVLIFSAAGYQKQAAQSSLIKSSGPSQASQADNTTLALYGISVNFGEGTISYAQASDRRPSSVVELAISNDRQLLKTSKQAALNEAYDNWLSATQTNVSLDAYNRIKLMDPGHRITQTGLMAKGTGGTHFERGQVDIDLSGV